MNQRTIVVASAAPSAPSAEFRSAEVAENEYPVQQEVDEIGTQHDQHTGDRPVDPLEKETGRGVHEKGGNSPTQHGHHLAATHCQVRRLAQYGVKPATSLAYEHDDHAIDRTLHQSEAPNPTACLRIARTVRLGGKNHGAQQ